MLIKTTKAETNSPCEFVELVLKNPTINPNIKNYQGVINSILKWKKIDSYLIGNSCFSSF